MKSKKEKFTFIVMWIFLLCYFMMLFDFPNKLTILFGSMICLGLWIRQRAFRLDVGICLLTLTMASYHIIVYGMRAFTMSLPYVPLVVYVLGNYISCEIYSHNNKEQNYIWVLFAIVIGYSIHGLLNSYMYMSGNVTNGGRYWLDFWLQVHLPGPWQCVYFLPVSACCAQAILFWKKNKLANSIIIAVALFFVYISVVSRSRMSIVILVLVFFALILLYVILEYEKTKNIIKDQKTWICFVITLITFLIVLYCLRDNETIKQFVAIWGRNGGILNNIRFKMQRAAIQQLFMYPMGGNQMYLYGSPHAHNAWLSMADAAGLIPFGLFVGYTVLTLVQTIRWLAKKEISTERKIMATGILAAFFLFFTVERIFEGALHFLTPYVFINGLIHGELSMMKNH